MSNYHAQIITAEVDIYIYILLPHEAIAGWQLAIGLNPVWLYQVRLFIRDDKEIIVW